MSSLDDLRALIDGAQGEAIEVLHPNQFRNTVMTDLTAWQRSELPSDYERDNHGALRMVEEDRDSDFGRPLTYVRGKVVQMVMLDEYNEPYGEPTYAIQAKVDNPAQKNKDISSYLLNTFEIKELRKRFPVAVAEFERKIGGHNLPIYMLDTVPPHVIQLLRTKMGVKTIGEFAAFDDALLDNLRSVLDSYKLNARSPYVARYRDAAIEKAGVEEPRRVGRPAKEKAAA